MPYIRIKTDAIMCPTCHSLTAWGRSENRLLFNLWQWKLDDSTADVIKAPRVCESKSPCCKILWLLSINVTSGLLKSANANPFWISETSERISEENRVKLIPVNSTKCRVEFTEMIPVNSTKWRVELTVVGVFQSVNINMLSVNNPEVTFFKLARSIRTS